MSNIDYRSPEWVAEQLGIDKNTVYKFLQDGILPALQLGRKWLISEQDLVAWLQEETQRQTEARRKAAESTSQTRRLGNYTPETKLTIKTAHAIARDFHHEKYGQGHILLAIEDLNLRAAQALRELSFDFEGLRESVERAYTTIEGEIPRRLSRTEAVKEATTLATNLARNNGRERITPADLLLGILEAKRGVGYDQLTQQGITLDALESKLNELTGT